MKDCIGERSRSCSHSNFCCCFLSYTLYLLIIKILQLMSELVCRLLLQINKCCLSLRVFFLLAVNCFECSLICARYSIDAVELPMKL
jgi:hypothetical protein